jgi:hypothetical protein
MADIEVPVPGTDETYKVTSMGAAAASMKFGAAAGCTIGLVDIAKVFLPVLAFRLLYPGGYAHLVAAIAGMVGTTGPSSIASRAGVGSRRPMGACSSSIGWVRSLCRGRAALRADRAAGFHLRLYGRPDSDDPLAVVHHAGSGLRDLCPGAQCLFAVAMIPDLRQYLRLRKQGAVDLST